MNSGRSRLVHLHCNSGVVGLCLFVALLHVAPLADAADRLTVFNANTGPVRIAPGPNGQLFVTDPQVGSVFIYDSNLTLTGEIKDVGRPLGIAVNANGRIYVGNDAGDYIAIYDSDGELAGVFAEQVVKKPNDLAIDLDGNIYVADSDNDRVAVFDSTGEYIRSIGSPGSGDGEFDFPISVSVEYYLATDAVPVGELIVGDQGNARVQIFDLSGNYLRDFGSKVPSFGTNWVNRFNMVQSVVTDDLGRPHVLDSFMCSVQVFDAASETYVEAYGTFGTGAGELNLPLDIAFTDNGDVVVANSKNHRIEVVYTTSVSVVSLSANLVSEMSPTGTVVGTLSVSPPAASNTFLLVSGFGGPDNDLFTRLKLRLSFILFFIHYL